MRSAITEPQLEADEQAATLRVTGFASRPEVQRTNRNGIYVFVNRRLVRDRLLLHAIGEAYRNITPPGVFPVVLLFLDLPYQEVDVNVHPAKIEVRFRHPQFVHDFTRDALRHGALDGAADPGFSGGARRGGRRCSWRRARFSWDFHRGVREACVAMRRLRTRARIPGPPRAEIPIALASSPGVAEAFELSGAPDQPLPQRLQFGSDGATNFPFAVQDASNGAAIEATGLPGPHRRSCRARTKFST